MGRTQSIKRGSSKKKKGSVKEDSEMDNHVNNAREVIFLDPVCSHNIWGGSRLGEEFGYGVEGSDIG